MASTRISTPVRGVTLQFSRLSIRREPGLGAASTSFVRNISTSPSSLARITTSAPISTVIPPEDRTVTATIHHFPSLEPVRFETYPANHLYLPTRRDILHRAVIYEGDNRFRTASTKWRSEIHGSARKIRPQKGTGRARAGDKKAPHMKGGGVAFGPTPRDMSTGLQKKVYDLAWRTALSYRFRKGELVIVDNAMEIEKPSPGLVNHIFSNNKWGRKNGRSVLVTLQDRPLLAQAMQETPDAGWTATWENVDVKDLLSLGRIVIERPALRNILLSHQEDLTRSSFAPKLESTLEPSELQAYTGWAEFAELEVLSTELQALSTKLENASPQQRETEKLEEQHKVLKAEYDDLKVAYLWHVGEARVNEAPAKRRTTRNTEHTDRMEANGYHLQSEARRLQIMELVRDPILRYEDSEHEEWVVQALEKGIEVAYMQAEMEELRAKSLEKLGDERGAEEARRWAEESRAKAEEKQGKVDYLVGAVEVEDAEVENKA